jgi:hypothetical protein
LGHACAPRIVRAVENLSLRFFAVSGRTKKGCFHGFLDFGGVVPKRFVVDFAVFRDLDRSNSVSSPGKRGFLRRSFSQALASFSRGLRVMVKDE